MKSILNITPKYMKNTKLIQYFVTVLVVVSVITTGVHAYPVGVGGDESGTTNLIEIVDVTPSSLTIYADEPTTVRVTIRNKHESAIDLDEVLVRSEQVPDTFFGSVRALGTLEPGENVSVPVEVEFGSSGVKWLQVEVRGTAGVQTIEDEKLAIIRVEEDPITTPTIAFRGGEFTADAWNNLTFQIVNPNEESITDLRVELKSESRIADPVRITPTLGPGEMESFDFEILSEDAGKEDVEAEITYIDSRGDRNTITRKYTVRFDGLADRTLIDASVVEVTPQKAIINVSISNPGDLPLRNVLVVTTSEEDTVNRQLLSDIDTDDAQRIQFNVDLHRDRFPLDILVMYEVGVLENRRTTSVTRPESIPTAEVVLTGTTLEREEGKLKISGNIGNTGTADAEAVVVQPRSTSGVTPRYPGKRFFVGTVPANDFKSYEVFVETDGEAEIPLVITYEFGGETRGVVVTIDPDRADSQLNDNTSETNIPYVPIAAIVGVLILGVVLLGWYRAGSEPEGETGNEE